MPKKKEVKSEKQSEISDKEKTGVTEESDKQSEISDKETLRKAQGDAGASEAAVEAPVTEVEEKELQDEVVEEIVEVAEEVEEAKAPKEHHKVTLTPKKYQHGKNHRKLSELIEKGKEYPVEEAVALLKKTSQTKFDATVEVHVNLNIDPSNADHQVRGSVALPAGLGKSKKVCAIVNADKEKEAKEAGAETVGGQDIIAKIEKGWLDFEVLVATPDMMGALGKIGRILGTKGLMPNPKNGTVSNEPGKAIKEIKKGRAEYKIDKQGSLHSAIGKISMKEEELKANLEAYLGAIHHAKPASVKGTFIKSIFLTTTMGPSIKLEK